MAAIIVRPTCSKCGACIQKLVYPDEYIDDFDYWGDPSLLHPYKIKTTIVNPQKCPFCGAEFKTIIVPTRFPIDDKSLIKYSNSYADKEDNKMNTQKEVNLVPAIKELTKFITEEDSKHTKRMKPYKESLDALRSLNTVCEKCEGQGKVLRGRSCAEDDRPDPNDPFDYTTCPCCGGSGKNTYNLAMP